MGRYLLNRTRVCASLTESSKNVWRSECITQSVASCKCSLLLILPQFLVKMIKRNYEIWSRDSRLTGTQSRFNNDLILNDEIPQLVRSSLSTIVFIRSNGTWTLASRIEKGRPSPTSLTFPTVTNALYRKRTHHWPLSFQKHPALT